MHPFAEKLAAPFLHFIPKMFATSAAKDQRYVTLLANSNVVQDWRAVGSFVWLRKPEAQSERNKIYIDPYYIQTFITMLEERFQEAITMLNGSRDSRWD